jgi:hypothetical protein
MTDAAELIEGRVTEYHPPRGYLEEQTASTPPPAVTADTPVSLAELFTCLDHAATQASELAFVALSEYFEGVDVVLIQHHVPWPALDPLVTDVSQARARYFEIKTTPAAVFDGVQRVAIRGDAGAAEKVFAAYRKAALRPTATASSCKITGSVVLGDSAIRGRLGVDGEVGEGPLRLHVVLCERLVMAPGANGVVMHRNVVRAGVSPKEGYVFGGSGKRKPFPFRLDLEVLSSQVEAQIRKMEQAGKIRFSTRPTYIDPQALAIVAWVQDHKTKRVFTARRFDLAEEGDET